MVLPEKVLLPENEKEKISDWVLKKAQDFEDVSDCLDKRKCDKCGAVIYDCALTCFNCQATWKPCVVSGYPIVGSDTHEFGGCNE